MPLREMNRVQHWDKDSLTPEVVRALAERTNRQIKRLRPDDLLQNAEELVNQFMNLPPVIMVDLWAVTEDGQMVAQGLMQCASIGLNEDQAQSGLLIDPQWRRQGLGSELLRRMAAATLGRGRTMEIGDIQEDQLEAYRRKRNCSAS